MPRPSPRAVALTLALGAAYAAALVALWLPRFLPFSDLPQHLAAVAVWRGIGDPVWRFAESYALGLLPVPYWGFYYPTWLLSFVLPVEAAAKVVLSLYAAALPASVALLGRRFGRGVWVALPACAMVFNPSLGFGFTSFCLSLPLAFVSLALLDRFLAYPTRRAAAALLAAVVATFFTHVLSWAIFGVCAAPLLLAYARSWRRAFTAAGLLLLTVALALADYRLAARGGLYGMAASPAFDAMWLPWRFALGRVPEALLIDWPGAPTRWMTAALALGLGALTVAALRAPKPPPPAAPRLHRWLPLVWCALCVAGYFALPFHVRRPLDWYLISPRLATPAALFALLAVPTPRARKSLWLLAPVALVAVAHPLLLTRQSLAFDARMAGMVRLLEHVPRGASTLTLALGGWADPDIGREYVPYLEVHCYPTLLRGGYNPFLYDNGFPFRNAVRAPPPLAVWQRPERFVPVEHLPGFDFLLTHREASDGALLARCRDAPASLDRAGDWRLYRVGDFRCAPR